MTKNVNDDFRNLIIKLRERAGMSAHKLSIEAGLSGSYVSKMERGDIYPSVEALAKMVLVLDPSPIELYILVKSMVVEVDQVDEI